jgi:dihydroorotase
MLEFYRLGKLSLKNIVQKMCHNPAIAFQIQKRGFIREGYFADLVVVDLHKPWTVKKDNILSKAGWSPLEGVHFQSAITHTIVSGHLAYAEGQFDDQTLGRRLEFDRN